MANAHGGKRAGAGRKPKAEKFAPQIDRAEKRIADRLPELIDNQFALALGGGIRTESRYELARGVLIEAYEQDENGRIVKVKRQLFPDAAEDALVLVEKKEVELGPDRAANEYLIDRILGKPTAIVEAEVSGKDGEPIEVTAPAMEAAARELAEWRKQMTEALGDTVSSLQSAPPTPPTSATPTTS